MPSEANFKLSSSGKGHFLTMLALDEGLNEVIWKNLPGFSGAPAWSGRGRARRFGHAFEFAYLHRVFAGVGHPA